MASKKMRELRRRELLAYQRALKMKKQATMHTTRITERLEPLSMEEIDRIKHESRGFYKK
jgi:hypothetical protein